MSSKKMITLKSLDGETFQVEEAVAKKSLTIKHMIEDGDDDDMIEDEVVHLRKVTQKVLSRVIEYSKKHVADEKEEEEEELKAWDQEFVVKTDKSTLCNLLLAANYLKIQSLLVLLSKNAFHKTEADDMRAILKGF